MSPVSEQWTEAQWTEFLEALAYVRDNLSATAFRRCIGVSRQAANYWSSRTSSPSAENYERVVWQALALRESLISP